MLRVMGYAGGRLPDQGRAAFGENVGEFVRKLWRVATISRRMASSMWMSEVRKHGHVHTPVCATSRSTEHYPDPFAQLVHVGWEKRAREDVGSVDVPACVGHYTCVQPSVARSRVGARRV